MKLGLNIDHIATLREARKINYPDPLEAIFIAQNAGVDQITLHLREDRRHIHDDDIKKIIACCALPVNIECACNEEIVEILCSQRPHKITLVPEKREEITTEGGLNLDNPKLKDIIKEFQKHQIITNVFIQPHKQTILKAKELGVNGIELHTGEYANAHLMLYTNFSSDKNAIKELKIPRNELNSLLENSLKEIIESAYFGKELSLSVFAGHGLNYANVDRIAKISPITELNIGHSIISRAVFVGLERAVQDMIKLIRLS